MVRRSVASGNCEIVEEMTTQLMEEQPWAAELFGYRAKCYEAGGKLKAAIHDLRHASKLSVDSTDILFDISQLQYKVADARESLK